MDEAFRAVTIAYVGVPLNVLVACAIGSYCSFSFSERIEKRNAMFTMFLTCLFMGAAFTSVVNAMLVHYGNMTMTDGLQAGSGAIVSFVTRFTLPWLVTTIKTGQWVDWIPFLRRKDQ